MHLILGMEGWTPARLGETLHPDLRRAALPVAHIARDSVNKPSQKNQVDAGN
jgi:hypothetical protein